MMQVKCYKSTLIVLLFFCLGAKSEGADLPMAEFLGVQFAEG